MGSVGLRQRRGGAQRIDRRRAHRRAHEGRHLSSWRALDEELGLWAASGRCAELWLRDDDATRASPALDRLLEIAAGIPVSLAVIPALVEPSLPDRLLDAPSATILQHGYAHRNYAAPGERNWELGSHRPVDAVIGELQQGQRELARRFGPRFLPVLVPPWNRIDAEVAARLPQAGFQGLSTFGARAAVNAAPGLVQCNTHVDLIAWRKGRVFIGADSAIERLADHLRARRQGTADRSEPTGVLTHHLDFDDDAWQFLEDLVTHTGAHRAAAWIDAPTAFRSLISARSA